MQVFQGSIIHGTRRQSTPSVLLRVPRKQGEERRLHTSIVRAILGPDKPMLEVCPWEPSWNEVPEDPDVPGYLAQTRIALPSRICQDT